MTSRACEKYMETKMESGYTLEQAQEAWDKLDTVFKLALIDISRQEVINFEDIRLGLLATLHSYKGLPHVKKLFEEAIQSVEL